MARRRYSKPRCKAKLGNGKSCRKFAAEDSETCGIASHRAQFAVVKPRKAVTPQRARVKTLAKQALFLKCYAQHGVLSVACQEADVATPRHYEWLERDDLYPDYPTQFAAAYEQANDLLEREAIRRGFEGWEEPKFGSLPGIHAGTGEVGKVRRFSDRLLETMLRARRPEKFREKGPSVNVNAAAAQLIITLPDNGRARDSKRIPR